MRKHIRDQIIELLPTIWEGVEYVKTTQSQQTATVLNDCAAAFDSISNSLQEGLTPERYSFYENLIIAMKNTLEAIHDNILSRQLASDYASNFKVQLDTLHKELSSESEIRLEVVFMPYKTSMWDCMESIWRAAQEDDRCDAYVVPIPYYDRNPDRSLGTFHYEGAEYPDYVPIVHYGNYDVNARQPDVIYIHNPYDELNFVTSVDPRFYSYNLKKSTNMLVYVPYFISGAYVNTQVFAQKHITSCVNHVDKIIVQSNTHKELYIKSGVHEGKLLVLGTPKLDAVASLNKDNVDIPNHWVSKINRKKTIVFNSSIGPLLNDPNYLGKLKARLSIILSHSELVLIWRPHPLLETTITSMRPALYETYKEIIQMIENSDHAILDRSASTEPATIVSDGMISDLSSWARQYFATGKPVLMLNGKRELKKDRTCVFDHFSSYFVYDGFSIEEFCAMVQNNEDPKKEARMQDLRYSIANIDGNSGYIINETITGLLG